jgi:hypothetical protein
MDNITPWDSHISHSSPIVPPHFNNSSNFDYNWSSAWYPYPHQFLPFPSYPYNPPTTPINTASASTSGIDKQYVVKFLNNRIKKCYGCSSEFTRKVDGSLPDPPLNLVISHEERREFRDASNALRLGNNQNVYYHPNVSCIRRRNASFVGQQIVIPADIALLESHKTYLKQYFNCSFD